MQTWMMENVPVSDDSRAMYRGRDTAVSSVLSQSPHLSFPVALRLLPSFLFLFLGNNSAFVVLLLGECRCIVKVNVSMVSHETVLWEKKTKKNL